MTLIRMSSFPHARGDGPVGEWQDEFPIAFSPRPWGWSGLCEYTFSPARVFPTPVGMVRLVAASRSLGSSFPHARGDGPLSDLTPLVAHPFSPRPWGWSVAIGIAKIKNSVFPTPVGMVRTVADQG